MWYQYVICDMSYYVICHASNICHTSWIKHHRPSIIYVLSPFMYYSSLIYHLLPVTCHKAYIYMCIYIYTEKYVTSNANLSYIYCNNMHVTCTLQLYYYITKHPQALQPGDIFFFQVTKPARKLAASFRSGYRQGFLQTLLRESKKILHTIVLNLTQVQSLV